MREQEFGSWLEAGGANTAAGRATRIHAVRTIEQKMAALGSPHADLETAWRTDRFEHLRQRLKDLREDFGAGESDYRVLMPQSERPSNRLASWRSWLGQYGRFLSGEPRGDRDADLIRQHVLEHYIEPARARDDDTADVLVRDVNETLGLNQAWPNICQALMGRKFLEMADLEMPERIGADQSSATIFRFRLHSAVAPESDQRPFVLFDGEGAAFKPVKHHNRETGRSAYRIKPLGTSNRTDEALELESIVAVAKAMLVDGRPARVQSVRGGAVNYLAYGKQKLVRYELSPDIAREIGVSSRGTAQRSPLDRRMLERLKLHFLQRRSDFRTFVDSGNFGRDEDEYKRTLLEQARQLMSELGGKGDAELGAAMLDLVAGRGQSESNLLGWRMANGLTKVRQAHPTEIESAAGRLARARDGVEAVAVFVSESWRLLSEGQEQSLPYGDSRTIPTMIRALIEPDKIFAIRSTPTDNASMMLRGKWAFSKQLTGDQLSSVIDLAREVFVIMRDEWLWAPRDLWDVQGFIWETCQKRLSPINEIIQPQSNQGTTATMPRNIILYGPPGTGKTYATALEAVRLCGVSEVYADTSEGRAALMADYRKLVEARQIEFVTFHQNFSYEEFVEGLRPETGAADDSDTSASAGFRLEPQAGIFREIALLAEQARSVLPSGPSLDLRGRKVFKMSLGRAGVEDHIFQDAIDGGYAVLGWGGDIDWSPYVTYEEIHARWNQDHPGTNGNDANIVQTTRFRADMREGDVIVVSYGNKSIRAIGVVSGPYTFAPTSTRDYNHRRAVNWLRVFDEPVPVDLIYDRPFIQWSCYHLNDKYLNRQALANLLPGEGAEAGGAPKQFVLVIDEINRANISKVFGELITLLEPDKRLGMPNALTVRLPYSKREFGVPANLHIIGTMNTADRSIALLDTALRRRFEFRELMPDPSLLRSVNGIDLAAMLTSINERIEYLFDREHQIGHAYFIDCNTKDDVDAVMRNKVIPLLAEYFFEDWSKVAVVLGDGDDGEGDREGSFIDRKRLTAPKGLGGDEDTAARYRWVVRPYFSYDRFTATAQ